VLAKKPNDPTLKYLIALSYGPSLVGAPYTSAEISAHKDEPARTVLKMLGASPDDSKFATQMPAACLLAAQANFKVGEPAKADKYARMYLQLHPKSIVGQKLLKDITDLRPGGSRSRPTSVSPASSNPSKK